MDREEQKHLQAVVVRYSPEQLAVVRGEVVRTLRDWMDGVSHHPTMKEREEEALRDLRDDQRNSLEARAKSWENLDNRFNCALVAYGFDPAELGSPQVSRLITRGVLVAMLDQGEGKNPWRLTVPFPILMEVQNKGLEVSEEHPDGHGGVVCDFAEICVPSNERGEARGHARTLGVLMRNVTIAAMRDKPKHRHRYSRDDGSCSCGGHRPEASQ